MVNHLFEEYENNHFKKIQGWANPQIFNSFRIFESIQSKNNISGDIAEIGVHHGKFFFILDSLRKEDEISVAVDIFGDQFINIDRSGKGDLTIFKENIKLLGREKKRIIIHQGDSTVMSSKDFLTFSKNNGYKYFSVDGGHTVEHIVNDLDIASKVIVNGGVVILDDFYNVLWPGVTEGFYKYMNTMNRNLAPFAYHGNKLFITTISYHPIYLDCYYSSIKEKYNNNENIKIKGTTICNFKVVSIK